MGVMEETVATVLAKISAQKTSPLLYAGVVQQNTFFIPVDISEYVVKSVVQKLSGSSGPVSTDSEALQEWLLKFIEDSKKLRISIEIFVDLIANNNPPWASYCSFMFGCLITVDGKPGVCLVGVG